MFNGGRVAEYLGGRVPSLVAELFRPWCTKQCGRTRMWYVGGSRPDGAQVGRFSFWGTDVPKGFLAEMPTSRRVHKSLNRILIKEAILVLESESALHQRGPLGRTVP